MATLYYLGASAEDRDLQNRQQVQTQLDGGVSRPFADDRAVALATPKAFKTYVDTQDSLYAESSYYPTQDALLVPNAARGAASGVASLDSGGKVPVAQTPNLGVGYAKGPFGPNTFSSVTTTTTPASIATWSIGVAAITFKPLVFMNMFANVHRDGQAIVEVRIGTTAQTTYASQTLVAMGPGRTLYGDFQAISVIPAPDTTALMSNGTQTGYSPSLSYALTAWVYDANGQSVSVTSTHIMGSAWLLRVLP